VNDRSIEVGGDVVTAINGEPVRSSEDLLVLISLQAEPGQEVTLTIIREGRTQEVIVQLGTRPVTFERR
jgi:2-alkenal reductase